MYAGEARECGVVRADVPAVWEAGESPSLAECLREFASGEAATLVVAVPHRVEDDVAVPPHVRLRVEAAGRLDVADGARLTVLGPMDAPAGPVFTGAGQVRLDAPVCAVLPQWWGAAGDGVRDDTAALRAAFAALPPAGGVLWLAAGSYRVRDTLTLADRLDCRVVFEAGAFLVSGGHGGFALEVRGCDRWMVRGARVLAGDGVAGGIRVHGASRRGMLYRPAVEVAGTPSPAAVGLLVQGASALTEVYEPTVLGGDAAPLAVAVRVCEGSDGCRVVGGELRGARVGVAWESSDGGMLDGTAMERVETGVVLSSDPEREAGAQFVVASVRFERVACGVHIRSVAGRGVVRPPILTDLRHAGAIDLVRCVPGIAYRLIAPVAVAPRLRDAEVAAALPTDDVTPPAAPSAGTGLVIPFPLPDAAPRARRWGARSHVPRPPAA